jgi:CheY-like chemotaxis protein
MNKKKILIIEDDANIREVLELALVFEGYDIFCAVNGKDGIDQLAKGISPDLILLDLMMPIMNGWEFVEKLSMDQKNKNVPVVVISAFTEKNIPIKCSAFVPKPFDLTHLLNTLKEHA